MTLAKLTVYSQTSQYHIIFKKHHLRNNEVTAILTAAIYEPPELLQPLNPEKYFLLGCYHGDLASGEHPLSDQKEIDSKCDFNFKEGKKLAILKKHKNVIYLSSPLTKVAVSFEREAA